MRSSGYPTVLVMLAGAIGIAAFMWPAEAPELPWPDGPMPRIVHGDGEGTVRVIATAGSGLRISGSPTGAFQRIDRSDHELAWDPSHAVQAAMLAQPTAVQWDHPLPGLPCAQVLRAAEVDQLGRVGPVRMHTEWTADHGELLVVSLALPEGSLFDPDTGIYVVGNAILKPPSKQLWIYQEDARWWKYPGNYSMRGKAWERAAHLQVLRADGTEEFQGPVGVRIHGNMTRGFPLKALRLSVAEPLEEALFPGDRERGVRSMVLRPGGNDGNRALMRDAVANELCAELPFEVSRARPAVLYLNGAYWGIHHMRQRLDEKELAARCGARNKDVQLLEVELSSIFGDPRAVERFRSLVRFALESEVSAAAYLDRVEQELDLDNFIAYMASCMILGQRDWPLRNVRAWRHTGPAEVGLKDGRWRFVMNDMDLCMGAIAAADGAVFNQLDRQGYPLADLWRGLMRVPLLQERFLVEVERQLGAELSTERMLRMIDRFAQLLDPETDRHVLRWRKPASRKSWEREVEGMRTFARDRPAAVRRQLAAKGWTQ